MEVTIKPEEYQEQKEWYIEKVIECAESYLPGLKSSLLDTDMFTPKTIENYTGHFNGAVYGSPIKFRNGKTEYENLYLIGTDQGFLGITGAMLSGISIANLYGFSA